MARLKQILSCGCMVAVDYDDTAKVAYCIKHSGETLPEPPADRVEAVKKILDKFYPDKFSKWCPDPPTLGEPDRPIRCPSDCNLCVAQSINDLVEADQSVQATARGFKELDNGMFVTLEDLEKRVGADRVVKLPKNPYEPTVCSVIEDRPGGRYTVHPYIAFNEVLKVIKQALTEQGFKVEE